MPHQLSAEATPLFTSQSRKEQTSMAWFYEIRSSNSARLRRDVGFPTHDAAKTAGREDAKKMKSSCQLYRTDATSVNENHMFRPQFF
jgi:hypothetical protein